MLHKWIALYCDGRLDKPTYLVVVNEFNSDAIEGPFITLSVCSDDTYKSRTPGRFPWKWVNRMEIL